MFNGMIVIPQKACALTVGIVVVLELSRGGNVFCPTVPRSALETLCCQLPSANRKESEFSSIIPSMNHANGLNSPESRC